MGLKELIAAYNATGRIAFYHPRQHRVSLGGGRSMPEEEAIKRIKECLNREGKEE